MKIAVLGTGVVALTISKKLVQLDHDVMIGTRSVTDAMAKSGNKSFGTPPLKDWLAEHPKIQLGTLSEAAAFAGFVVNATNGVGSLQTLGQAGKQNLAGKILLDIANPLDFSKGAPPSLFVSNTDSLGEQIQAHFPNTKVVKCLNTMNCNIMVNPLLLPEDHNVFLSGNDNAAKGAVKALLKSFGWKEQNMIDLGDISTARGTEQLLPIWIRLWGALKNPMFNFKIVKA
jgi:8-hydroxy-5-deazaflavin:NADPH oxidoreductase